MASYDLHGSVQGSAFGNANIVLNYFAGADVVAALPTQYRSRILSFLEEYLGRPGDPRPFGGREMEIASLDDWRAKPDAPYLFLAAPAGRGKSALLAQFSSRLIARESGRTDRLRVLFVPVSIRFATNTAEVVYTALASGLSRARGEPPMALANMSPTAIGEKIGEMLRLPLPAGRQVLIILDGLDEAADLKIPPGLFPTEPPSGLEVILSARFRAGRHDADDWLREVGWHHHPGATLMSLPPLSLAGVAEVLKGVRGHRLALATEIHRLSEGDPLLVQLYARDLSRAGDAANDVDLKKLSKIAPGLDGYFEQWWSEQRTLWEQRGIVGTQERSVRTVLTLLSCALGPLQRDDLLALIPTDLGFDSLLFDETLRPLSRIVIGDGREQGYAFGHSRLATYFYDRLTRYERTTWEDRFVAWGRSVIEAKECSAASTDAVPAYLVRYLGAHFQRSGVGLETLALLVTGTWKAAWEAFDDGSNSGFLNDVEVVRRAAQAANVQAAIRGEALPCLPLELLCTLCRASAAAVTLATPRALAARLVETGMWSASRGLTFVGAQPSPEGQRAALIEMLPHLPESLLPSVAAVVGAITSESDRAGALIALAERLPDVLLPAAFADTRRIEDPLARAEAAYAVLSRMREPEREAAAREWEHLMGGTIAALAQGPVPLSCDPKRLGRLAAGAASSIVSATTIAGLRFEKPLDRSRTLAAMARALAESDRLDEAMATCRLIDDASTAVETLVALVPHVPESDRDDVIAGAIAAGLAALAALNDDGDAEQEPVEISTVCVIEAVVRLLPSIADESARPRLVSACLRAIDRLSGNAHWDLSMSLAPYLDNGQLKALVERICDNSNAPAYVVTLLTDLARVLPGELKVAIVRAAIQILDSTGNRWAPALVWLAGAAPEPLRTELFVEAFRVLRHSPFDDDIGSLLYDVVDDIPMVLLRDALDLLRPDVDSSRLWLLRPVSFERLVRRIPVSELPYAERLTRSIGDEARCARAMVAFAPFITMAERERLWPRVSTVRGGWAPTILSGILPLLPAESQVEAIEALQPQLSEHAAALRTLAPLVHHDTLDRIRDKVDHMSGPWRCSALIAIAEALPETERAAVLACASAACVEKDVLRDSPRLVAMLTDEQIEHLIADRQRRIDGPADDGLIPNALAELTRRGSREAFERLTRDRDSINYFEGRALARVAIALRPDVRTDFRHEVLEVATEWALRAAPHETKNGMASVLAKLIPVMPTARLDELLDRLAVDPELHASASIYCGIVPVLPERQVVRILGIALTSRDAKFLDRVLPSVTCRLAELGHAQAKRLIATRADSYSLQLSIAERAGHLPLELIDVTMATLCSTAQRELLHHLVPQLLTLPREKLYELWKTWLDDSAVTRRECLTYVAVLAPVVAALGDGTAAIGMIKAIEQAQSWWPS